MRFIEHSHISKHTLVRTHRCTCNGALLLSPFSHDAYARIPLSNAHRGLKPFMSNENEPTHYSVSCHDVHLDDS